MACGPVVAGVLFWQLFPLMATAFTKNHESANLLRFPLSYRAYFLIRLAYGSLDPATTVASLWLLGIAIGIGVAQPRLLPWALVVLFIFAIVNLLLARVAFSWLERWLAQRRTREIMGVLFFLCILSLQLIGPLIAFFGHKSKTEARLIGQELTKAQKPFPPGLAAAAIEDAAQQKYGSSLLRFLLLVIYGFAFLWLLNLRLRAEYLGENLSESARRKTSAEVPASHPSWNVPGLSGPVAAVFEKELRYLSRSGPMMFTLVVPLFMLLVFRSTGQDQGAVQPRSRADISAWRGILTAVADQSFLQQFWRRWRRHAVLFRLARAVPPNRRREESGPCGDSRARGRPGVGRYQPSLPAAFDHRHTRHGSGNSVCAADRFRRRKPVLDLLPHQD